jgi:predicted nucleic acid-binding Zn ribbon protein
MNYVFLDTNGRIAAGLVSDEGTLLIQAGSTCPQCGTKWDKELQGDGFQEGNVEIVHKWQDDIRAICGECGQEFRARDTFGAEKPVGRHALKIGDVVLPKGRFDIELVS